MKRATTLQVLAGTLVLTLVASAFPLAEIALNATQATSADANEAYDGEGSPSTGLPPLPFLPSGPDGATGASGQAGSLDGSSSRPGASYASQDRASASGSVLLSQVLGAAESLGYDVEIPPLPTDLLAPEAPLRAAILAWIASTGAVVPPDELATQLARADALPLHVQRDVALLLLSTIEASALQRAALAKISPQDLEWIYAHPEVAQQLLQGLDSPDTRRMAILAAKVDMAQTVSATLLLLQAIEATRGSLSDPAADDALALAASLDDATRAVLELAARADAASSDAEKVRLAARLVGIAGGVSVPEPRAAPTFEAALQRLVLASGATPAPAEIDAVVARAQALPDDLAGAIARLLEAEAIAIEAASPAGLTPTSQHEALAATLVATAEALPVLEKYHLYWRAAPDALRVSEWDAASRAGWAAHHIALVATAQDDLVGLVQVSELANGRDLTAVPALPERTFVEAYEAAALAGGFPVTDEARAAVADAADTLAPSVRDAATVLLSGAAESSRLRDEAFADLTQEEQRFLALQTDGLDALYAAPVLTEAELATLSRATALAARVDAAKLAQANAVAASAMTEATRILTSANTFTTQGEATPVPTGLTGLLRMLNPLGSARAQSEVVNDVLGECSSFFGVQVACANDVLLRIRYPDGIVAGGGYTPGETLGCPEAPGPESMGGPSPQFTGTPADPTLFQALETFEEFNGASLVGGCTQNSASSLSGAHPATCDERECIVYLGMIDMNSGTVYRGSGGQANRELLVITGSASASYLPEMTTRLMCASYLRSDGQRVPVLPCREEVVPRYGAPAISIDLGGDDTFVEPRAMVAINATLHASFHIDVGGNDVYANPSALYDSFTPLLNAIGVQRGHPTQASALFGGAAILVDVQGADVYEASTRSQGFARLGVGILADLGGDDAFSARELSQGVSSESFTLGAGILVNVDGADQYLTGTGQGYGLGGIFLDIGGDDRYANDQAPMGIPVVQLDVLPGGDLTAFDTRGDDVAWLDGPASLSIGIGVDQEIIVAGNLGSDNDGIPDVIEVAFGTDPYDTRDSPLTNPGARATALLDDEDGDGYPGYIERALSTDPKDRASYPVGLPGNIAITIPAPIMGVVNTLPLGAGEVIGLNKDGTIRANETIGGSPAELNMTGSDKIVDLRLPIQDAGSITYACTGEVYLNQSVSGNENVFDGIGAGSVHASRNPDTNAPNPDSSTGSSFEHCAFVSYQSAGDGKGNASVPAGSAATATKDADDFTFQLPAGLVAIGDIVNTSYVDDYLVVIDLGGTDTFTNAAGGAVILKTRPRPEEGTTETDATMRNVNQTFFAPTLVVNVDLAAASQGVVASGAGGDRYVAPTRDFAHGAYFGLLLDTSGNDIYVARDASQGALGGVLLDLGGSDSYVARNLAQGAGLAGEMPSGVNVRATSDVVEPGSFDRINVPGTTPSSGNTLTPTQRRALPGILLDGGDLNLVNAFTAGAHAQGFARGFATVSGGPEQGNPPTQPALGILASLGDGDDRYKATGRYGQGVGGYDGVGILVDRTGTDDYQATGLISQGATISQLVGTQQPRASTQPHPATGVLVDLAGVDKYFAAKPVGGENRNGRNDNTTITRSETAQTQQASVHLYADSGVHIDWVLDPSNPMAFVSTVGGAGDDGALAEDAAGDFVVNLPTARLAIGGEAATRYAKEYAFVVDLGGDNAYDRISAGGHLRGDVLAAADPGTGTGQPVATGTYQAPLKSFPVTVFVDAGNGSSSYVSEAGFSQGAGFFGIGILADLGGRDTLVALPEPLTGGRSEWTATAPVVDGTIGNDWSDVAEQKLTLVAQRDARFTSDWTMRLANDERTLYMALVGSTMSNGTSDRIKDKLTIHFDMGRRAEPWNLADDRTGVDTVELRFDEAGNCVAVDRTMRATAPYASFQDDSRSAAFWADFDEVPRFEAACRSTEDGKVLFELRKDLVIREPLDKEDLSYCYDELLGYGRATVGEPACVFPADEIGIYLEFLDTGAGFYMGGANSGNNAPPAGTPFSWPAGATQVDGALGHLKDNNLTDEMTRWGAFGLAEKGADGARPIVDRPPSLSHGAAVAGVGVLAMLGTSGDASVTAGDRALGYGALQGLGILIDLGGSDRYEGRDLVLGASEGLAAGLVLDLNGNDNYVTRDRSIGYTPAGQTVTSGAAFMDLGGDDQYVWTPRYSALPVDLGVSGTESIAGGRVDAARGESVNGQPAVLPPPSNNEAWVQNGGAGMDYRLSSLVGAVVTDTVATVLYGNTRTNLTFTEVDVVNGKDVCSTRPIRAHAITGKPVVTSRACFRAEVDLNKGAARPSAFDSIRALAGTDSAAEAALKQAEELLANNSVSAGLNVTSVDFLADRMRLATAYEVKHLAPGKTLWTAIVDLKSATDGIVRVKAMPVFTTRLPNGDVMVFQEGNDQTNELADAPSHKSIHVDNAPRIAFDVTPEYTGIANAVASPLSALPSYQNLNTTFSVSADAGEERLNVYNGWLPHPAGTSFPCKGIPAATERPQLCHLLPFYLRNPGQPLSTVPGNSAKADPSNIRPEVLDGAPYTAKTDVTGTSLDVMLNGSFHLTLPDRERVLPLSTYTTNITLTLLDANGAPVLDAAGKPWVLATTQKSAPSRLGDANSVPALDLSAVTRQLENQQRQVENLSNGSTPVGDVVAAVYRTGVVCLNPDNSQVCQQYTGHYGSGQVRACKGKPGSGVNRQVYDAVQTVNSTYRTNVPSGSFPAPLTGFTPCTGASDVVNGTAAIADERIGNAFSPVFENVSNAIATANGALGSVGVLPSNEETSELNWKDFYFDVNPTPPRADFVAKGVRHGADRLSIPPGYSIALQFGLRSGGGDSAIRPGQPIRDAIGEVDAAVASTYPHGANPITDSVYENNIDFTLDQQQGEQTGFASALDGIVRGANVLPAAFFTTENGDPTTQARLEVRVPAESSTRVDVTLTPAGSEELAATILGGFPAIGDRPHPLAPTQRSGDGSAERLALEGDERVAWTVETGEQGPRWTQYNVSYASAVDDGIYVLGITASDAASQVTTTSEPVILDRTAPITGVTTSTFAGSATLSGGQIPVRWFATETTAGMKETFLYTRVGTEGDVSDISTWVRYPRAATGPSPDGYPATETSMRFQKSASEDEYLFLTVGVDRANNVEGTSPTTEDPLRGLEDALAKGFATKVGLGEGNGYTRVFLDLNDPRFLSVGTIGGKLLEYQGSDFTFLRAGQPVKFQVCVRDGDGESGIGGANLELFPVDPRHLARAYVSPMVRSGACGTNGQLYTHEAWSTVNTNATNHPEGIWRVQMQVYDLGGNTIRVSGGAVILDHAAPTVVIQDPVLPTGQTAVKPGDLVKIRLLATDAWGVDEPAIRVDATAFTRNATELTVRPVRVNGIIYQEAQFVVDKPNLQNGVFEIKVSVPDLAGGKTVAIEHLAVNFRPFEFVPGSLRVTNVTHNSLELRWTTDEPTSALVKYGTSAVTLSGRTPQVLNATKEHVILVDGLAPSTRYSLRAVSVSTGGFTKESEIIEAETTTALFLRPLAPAANSAVSGNVPVRFAAGLLDDAGFVTYTLEVRESAQKPWTFVTTATRQGDEHTLYWNSSRHLDGKTYQLRLTAEAGDDVAAVEIGPLTSDNTPASVLVVAPLIATNDTTPALDVEAGDSLAGFLEPATSNASATNAYTLTIDGERVSDLRVRLDDGRLRITHPGITGIEPGIRTFELQVKDRAGNVAKETWKVAIDGDAPTVKVNPTRYAPGTAAARNAGTVTLNLTIRDLSGVSTVVADTSSIATAPTTTLVKLVGTDTWQGTFTVSDATSSATRDIAVRATDLAGNVGLTTIRVPVDNVEPNVGATEMRDVTYTTAIIQVRANEPILVTGTATAPAAPAVTASTIAAVNDTRLELKGLLPSRTYRFSLTATDLAGNPVTLAGSFPTLKDEEPPTALGTLRVVDLLNGTLRISWDAAADNVGIAAYRVYRSADGGSTFELVAEVEGTTFEDRGLAYEKPYVYRVAALDHGANEGASSGQLRAAATAVPKLSAGMATPTVGTTSTVFQYLVTYVSPGGKTPAYVRVLVDGVPQEMTLLSGDALTGAIYVYETRLAPHTRDAPHTYTFETSDGRYTAKFPEDGTVLRGPLVSSQGGTDEEVGRLAAFAQRVPLGGVAGVAVAMIAAMAIAAVLRRKKEGSK